jgi:hypothetical protein
VRWWLLSSTELPELRIRKPLVNQCDWPALTAGARGTKDHNKSAGVYRLKLLIP